MGDVLDRVSDGVFVLDEEWHPTYLNDRAAAFVGRSVEELTGRSAPIWELVPELAGGRFQEELARAVEEQTEVEFDLHRDGRFEVRAYPAGDGLSVYVRDVTAEREADHLRLGYEQVLDSLAESVWIVDSDARLLYVNETVIEELGVSREEIVGERFDTRFPALIPDAEVADAYREAIEEVLDGEREEIRTEFTVDVGTASVVIDVSAVGIDFGPDARGAIGVARDVTERVRREEELRELSGFQEAIIENANVLLAVLDEEGRVSVWNEGAERITGYERGEMLGRDDAWDRLTPGADGTPFGVGDVPPDVEVAVEGYESTIRTSDGEERVVSWNARPLIDAGGDRQGLVALGRDVTRRVEYERRLERQRDQLEMLNRIARHDVRNDLSVVLGWAETLREELPGEYHDRIDRIVGTSRHTVELTETIRDLIELIRADSEMEVGSVALADVLTDEVTHTQRTHPDAVFEIEGDVPSVAVRGSELLPAVFRNLLNNAVQHNDEDTPRITVSVDEEGTDVAVRIADDGPGISARHRDEVFEASRRGLESSGTGMGLYFVQNLVEQYGGSVRIEDNEPKGTVFEVRLPRAGA